jgi:hypothetical protein
MAPVDPDTWVKPSPNQINSILEKSGTVRAGAYRSSGREWTKPNGLSVTADGTGLDVGVGNTAGVAESVVSVGFGATSVALVVAVPLGKRVGVAEGAILVGVGVTAGVKAEATSVAFTFASAVG